MNLSRFLFRLLMGRCLPITSGALEVPGVTERVVIRRDRYGIPHIEATNEADAWYALGFCQGQDRTFQLEGLLRVVRGTLSELVGPAGLPVDRLSRRIGFYRTAQEQLDHLDDEVRTMLEAYAQGVSDGARLGCPKPPHEFAFLQTRPTPYSAADALAVLKLMAFSLSSNWDSELVRLKILTEDGPEALTALDPLYPDWLPVTEPPTAQAGPALDRLAEDLTIFTATVGQGGGSNNWALAASRTATGRPILANDPHLAPTLPPHWYLAHIRTPDWAVAGASFVGAPGFPVGHNGTAAWGVTAGLVDNTDLFIEEVGPDGESVRQGDRFIPCTVLEETIPVKGGEPVKERVLITPRGPIVGPALVGEVGAISMQATWLAPRPLRGLFVLHKVRSFEEFRRAFEQWPALSLNMVYADTAGTIGWQLIGEVPRRRKGWGLLPLPGWDPEVGWEADPLPFEEVPHLANPETGFVATANNKPIQDGEGPWLGADWIDGYRLTRIVEALQERNDWDLADTMALQMDQQSLPWREMRDLVLGVPAETEEARQALELLRAWDGVVAADSPAAAVYESFVAEMARRIVEAKAPRAARWALGHGFTPIAPHALFGVRRVGHLVRLLREQPEGWFERPWPQEVADALTVAVRRLREQGGADPEQWAWGRLRPLILHHAVGEQAPLDRIFNLGPFPWGGDANTVAQAASLPTDPMGNPPFIASLRMVVDVGNWEASRFVLPGGQSGNPLSPHYDDQLPLWRRGEGVPIAWSPEAVERATRQVLELRPSHG